MLGNLLGKGPADARSLRGLKLLKAEKQIIEEAQNYSDEFAKDKKLFRIFLFTIGQKHPELPMKEMVRDELRLEQM